MKSCIIKSEKYHSYVYQYTPYHSYVVEFWTGQFDISEGITLKLFSSIAGFKLSMKKRGGITVPFCKQKYEKKRNVIPSVINFEIQVRKIMRR